MELISGAFTLIFFLGAFYFAIDAGLKEYGKRGLLFIGGVALLGPGFLFDLIAQGYESEAAKLLSHGLILLAGILFLLSVYLSKKEIEREAEATQ